MKLMTKTLEKRFLKVGSQGKNDDPIVIAKFFGGGIPVWLAIEYNPETKTFYGAVKLFDDIGYEFGYFSLSELEELKFPPLGLGVERDLYTNEKPISEYLKE